LSETTTAKMSFVEVKKAKKNCWKKQRSCLKQKMIDKKMPQRSSQLSLWRSLAGSWSRKSHFLLF
jgi:hypothetical protein